MHWNMNQETLQQSPWENTQTCAQEDCHSLHDHGTERTKSTLLVRLWWTKHLLASRWDSPNFQMSISSCNWSRFRQSQCWRWYTSLQCTHHHLHYSAFARYLQSRQLLKELTVESKCQNQHIWQGSQSQQCHIKLLNHFQHGDWMVFIDFDHRRTDLRGTFNKLAIAQALEWRQLPCYARNLCSQSRVKSVLWHRRLNLIDQHGLSQRCLTRSLLCECKACSWPMSQSNRRLNRLFFCHRLCS